MRLPDEWASKITDKNPDVAQKAAKHIINNKDMDAWSCLAENEDKMFDFIKDKVAQYIIDAVNENNFYNLFTLMQRYNDWLADIIALAASKFDDNTVSDQMIEYLINGDPDQQCYAARYFAYVEYAASETVLIKLLDSDNEILKSNAAEALSTQGSKKAYDILIKRLDSDDDFQKIAAAELLSALGDPRAIKPLLKAMVNSSMKENLASEAASIECIGNYFNSEDQELRYLSLEALDNIIIGIPEVLPLSNIIVYDLYSAMDSLLKLAESNHSELSGKYAQILLRARSKFETLINNEQYTFDESDETKEEIKHIHNILSLRDETFWDDMTYLLLDELDSQDLSRKASAINTVAEVDIKFACEKLINIICNETTPELILCDAVYALQELKCMEAVPHLKKLVLRIEDPNRAAIIQSAITALDTPERAAMRNQSV